MNLDSPPLLESPAARRAERPLWIEDREVAVAAGSVELGARFAVPDQARGAVLLALPSGISRHSSRERFVTTMLGRADLATLLVDLLTEDEDADRPELRLDVPLLADRMLAATDWLSEQPLTAHLPVGYLGEGAAVAGAFVAAAMRPGEVQAIVSRNGRPDLGGAALYLARVPTLLIVAGGDAQLLAANHLAHSRLRAERQLEVILGAGGDGLDRTVALALDWFARRLDPSALADD